MPAGARVAENHNHFVDPFSSSIAAESIRVLARPAGLDRPLPTLFGKDDEFCTGGAKIAQVMGYLNRSDGDVETEREIGRAQRGRVTLKGTARVPDGGIVMLYSGAAPG